MLSAPVVPGEIQPEHGVVIPRFLAVPVRQSREPVQRHSDGQVEPLHSTGSCLVQVDRATDDFLAAAIVKTLLCRDSVFSFCPP